MTERQYTWLFLAALALALLTAHWTLASPTKDPVAIVIRIVQTGNQDPYTVDVHLNPEWQQTLKDNPKLRHDVVESVRKLMEEQR